MTVAMPCRGRVAYQGEPGAFSEEAILAYLGPRVTPVPRPSFAALYDAIGEGAAEYILAPVENSLAGSVHASLDLLALSGLTRLGEYVHPIALCLLGVPGANLDTAVEAASHPVALAQCRKFLAAHPRLRAVPADDTAGSVRAIAGHGAAKLYGAAVLREHIEDRADNRTTFLLLAGGRL